MATTAGTVNTSELAARVKGMYHDVAEHPDRFVSESAKNATLTYGVRSVSILARTRWS